jgi:hypothetical protein
MPHDLDDIKRRKWNEYVNEIWLDARPGERGLVPLTPAERDWLVAKAELADGLAPLVDDGLPENQFLGDEWEERARSVLAAYRKLEGK